MNTTATTARKGDSPNASGKRFLIAQIGYIRSACLLATITLLLAVNVRAQIQQGMNEAPVQEQATIDSEMATALTDPLVDPFVELLRDPRVLQKASITERQLSSPFNQYASVDRLIEDFQWW